MLENLGQEDYRNVLESLPTGVYLVDRERRIAIWSAGAEELTGYRRHEVIGRACGDDLLMHCNEESECVCGLSCPLLHTMHDGQARTADLFLLHKDGSRVPVSVRAVPLRDQHGTIIGAVECFERRSVYPTADPVLGSVLAGTEETVELPGRLALEGRLRYRLRSYEQSAVPFAIVLVALNELESLHHAQGQQAVKTVLRATGHTLAATLGPNDAAGLWNEEIFLAIVTACSGTILKTVAERIRHLVHSQAVPWWGDRITVTASMGTAVVERGDTAESLVARARLSLENGSRQPAHQSTVSEESRTS